MPMEIKYLLLFHLFKATVLINKQSIGVIYFPSVVFGPMFSSDVDRIIMTDLS